jgi:3-hydroxyisobutyrate dehydrogenase-like beta-hydroxyacid dehydrogenase
MSDKPKVGFVGAGLMGHGMAKNIVDKGFPLTVLGHRNRQPIDDLLGRGANEATDPAGLVAASSMIVLCLPGSREVETFVQQALACDCTGRVFIDCTTSSPVSTRLLAAACSGKGAALVDAPLSRTPKEAWEGTLDVMLGASEAEAERVLPVLEAFAGRIIRVGEVGAGHTMKLLNNFVSLGYASLYAEALAIGARNGIDAATFDSVISGGRMDCGFYQTFMRYAVLGDSEAHKFTLRNAHKDMRYLLSVATESGIASYLAASVKNGFALAEASGRGDDYLPLLVDVVAELNGIDLQG